MTIEEQIYRYAQQLPPELRAELLDVAEYLALNAEQRERQLWNAFSLAAAMQDMDDEPELYRLDDIKVSFS